MSEKLCALRKKGGKGTEYTETSLWTNQSPSSSFASQNVSLSDSVSNYKYIKIRYNYSSSYSTIEVSGIISVDDLKKTTAGNRRVTLGLGQATAGNSYYVRYVNYVSDTSINITNVNAGSSGSTDIIPLEILGLNELDHGKRFDETTLWTNNAPTTSYAATDITLSDDVDNYDYIKFTCRYSTSNSATLSELCSVSDFKATLNTASTNMRFGVGSIASSTFAMRYLSYITDTTARISACAQGDASSDNSKIIPLTVVGCKFA